jgi:RNA chaperone Hfq
MSTDASELSFQKTDRVGRSLNAQFSFLNRLRRERSRVEVYLVSGTRLLGRVQSFDSHMLLLETETGQVALYHQSTATVQRALARPKRGAPRSVPDRPRTLMLRPKPASPSTVPEPVVVTRRRSRLLVKPEDE